MIIKLTRPHYLIPNKLLFIHLPCTLLSLLLFIPIQYQPWSSSNQPIDCYILQDHWQDYEFFTSQTWRNQFIQVLDVLILVYTLSYLKKFLNKKTLRANEL